MSNLHKAAEVILNTQIGKRLSPQDLAKALQGAGLLAPDLPSVHDEEIFKYWAPDLTQVSLDRADVLRGNNVTVTFSKKNREIVELFIGGHVIPIDWDHARLIAYALLAASDCVEKERGHEQL